MNKKKVVIIGATGTIGTYLLDYLVNVGFDVFAVGFNNVSYSYYRKRNIGCAAVDISYKNDFSKLPTDNIEAVVLLSGIMPSKMEGYDPQKYIDINIIGTLNTLEYCRKNNIKKIIFTQSHSDVAGYWNTGRYIKDDDNLLLNYKGDHAVYIISKNTAVDLIKHYTEEYNIQSVVFRLPTIYSYRPISNMYVNGQLSPIGYRLFIEKAIKGKTIEIWGDSSIAKDIVYVKDLTRVICAAINSDKVLGIYNVGSGIPTTLDQQIKGIVDVFCDPDNKSKLIYKPEKRSQNSYLYDISKLQREFNYIVRFPYVKMLKDMKKEMQGNRFAHLTSLDNNVYK